MNVLHICEDFITGGIESFLVDLCRAMQPEVKSKVAFLYGQDCYGREVNSLKRQEPFDTIALSMAKVLRLDPIGVIKLARIVRTFEADVLHCHSYYCALAALVVRPMTGRIPIVYTVHATLHPGKHRSDFLVRAVARASDAVISVSTTSALGMVAITSGSVDPIVILNGIDPERVRHSAGFQRTEYRRELGIPIDSLVLLNIAALTANKDQASLIKSLSVVRRRFANAVLLIAGTGPEQQNLQNLIDKSSMADCVRLLGVRYDIAELLSASDLFVLSSRSEGMAISILEACLAGVPVVCTAVGGAQELVTAGLDVALVPPGNLEALSAEIIRVASRGQVSEDKRATAHQLFSIRRTADTYISAYRQMQGAHTEAGEMSQGWR